MFSDEIKKIAFNLRSQGKSYGEIASILGLTRSAIQNLVNYNKKWHKKKRGPKFSIDKKQSTILKRFIHRENESGNKVNSTKILRYGNLPSSRRTVSRWLKSQDLKYKKEAQRILLTKKHKLDRIAKVSSWISSNMVWENTAFVDEKRFSLDGPDSW